MAQLVPVLILTVLSYAINATRKIEGPRLDSTKFTGGDYGAALPLLWGMRRLQVPIFWAEELREIKRRRKTKGGKFNDYTYYGTWAVAVAGHEIDAVRRIWFDTHLVYDLSGVGPASPFDFGKNRTGTQLSDYVTVYTGTETQDADPRMEATVEAEFGAGSCPAYRGTAYVVFKDIPLEKLGNRIPQVSVEAVSSSTATWPYEDTGLTTSGFAVSPDFSYVVASEGSPANYDYFDTAARAVMISGTRSPVVGSDWEVSVDSNGNFYGKAAADNNVYQFGPEGAGVSILSPSIGYFPIQTIEIDTTLYIMGGGTSGKYFFNGAESDTGDGATISGFFVDLDDGIWACGYTDPNTVVFRRVQGGGGTSIVTVTGLPTRVSTDDPDGAVHYREGAIDKFVFFWKQALYAVDRTTGAILYSVTSPALAKPYWSTIAPGSSSIWAGMREYATSDLSLIRALPISTWFGGGTTTGYSAAYDPINHALLTIVGSSLMWLYLDRVGSNGITLAEIADDLAGQVGVVNSDFTDLDQVIQGWSATRGQASNMLEPLLDAYDSDVRQHDFTMSGLKRTGTTGGTLTTALFAKNEPRYSITLRQGAELPRSVTINFADLDADQQPNNVRSDRPLEATGARGEQTIDLGTLALDADGARDLGDRFFRRLWNERKGAKLGLTAQQLALEPGDIRTLTLDDESITARLVRLDVKADGVLDTEWKYDHPSLALLSGAAGAAFDGRDESTVAVPLLSKGFVLDIPYIDDADDQSTPSVYVAAAPYAPGTWPGAVVYQATGGEYTDELASVESSSQATWGYSTDTLADANPNLWDRGNSVNVTLQVGSLSGTSEAAIDANATLNLCLIGDELVQFATATLEIDGSYTLSSFKRGRRGTEWACATHATRDVFLLLDTADDAALGLSEVGTDLSFKAITAGRTTGFPVDMEPFTGASLKPYAPCQLDAVKDSVSGDWVLTWVRRTRVGGAWTSGTSIPLSEASEEYEVEIMNGGSVVRTIAALSSPTTTWTAAQQTTDFGSDQSSVSWRVYQISDAVDRGFVATA